MGKPQRESYHHFIGGEYVTGSSTEQFESSDPATGNRLATITQGTATDVDHAVKTANRAFGIWRSAEPKERGRTLDRIAAGIRKREDALAELESLDQGKPLSQARSDVNTAARYFEYYAGAADKLEGKSIPRGRDTFDFTVRKPYGVNAQITPWNFPLSLAARGLGPALAAGNTVVMKPAPTTSLTTLELADICRDAGLPDGVFNVVAGGTEPGKTLSSHENVDTVTFTGSVPTGQAVMKSAAETVTPVTLELGGKNPAIVLQDADLEEAVDWIATGIFLNAGQVCSAADRALVHESIYDEFVERIVDTAESYDIGPGVENLDMGPLNHEEHLEKVLKYIEIGKKEGAVLRTGGCALERDGHFVAPTIFSDVANGMRIAQEEIFGPVLAVIPYSTTDEAIEIANDVEYGLTAGVFSRDITQGLSTARDIQAGTVYVNEWFGGGVEAPFGGVKNSGIGREKGMEALDSYLQTKSISVNLSDGG